MAEMLEDYLSLMPMYAIDYTAYYTPLLRHAHASGVSLRTDKEAFVTPLRPFMRLPAFLPLRASLSDARLFSSTFDALAMRMHTFRVILPRFSRGA